MLLSGDAMTQPIAIQIPSAQDRAQVQTALAHLTQDAAAGLRLQDLPEEVGSLVHRLLSEVAQGHAVQLIPVQAELKTQEAADLLGVSRPHLVKLLDEGKLASWKVGTHRRVKLQDLLAYRDQRDRERQQALQDLSDLDQELGLL